MPVMNPGPFEIRKVLKPYCYQNLYFLYLTLKIETFNGVIHDHNSRKLREREENKKRMPLNANGKPVRMVNKFLMFNSRLHICKAGFLQKMSHLKAQTEMTLSGLLTFEPQCEDIIQLFPTLNVLHMMCLCLIDCL